MFEKFTELAIKVIMLAQEEARRLGQNFVGTDFILLGLIGERTGIAGMTLKSNGVDLKVARVEVEKNLGRGTGYISIEIPFTQQAKRSLEMAWRIASEQFEHNYIGTEHLLLGLIAAGDDDDKGNACVKLLSTLGVNIDKLRTETIITTKETPATYSVRRKALEKETIELSAGDNTYEALVNALDTIRHAKKIAIKIQEFELAAWLREIETDLDHRTQTDPRRKERLQESSEPIDNIIKQFTEKAHRAYELAEAESRRLGHNFLGTEQILIGLIGEGTGTAAKTLLSMGATLKEARAEVEKIIGRGSGFVAKEIPATPRGKRVIQLARGEAQRLGHDKVDTEHLLLALVIEGEGVAARVLENLGCSIRAIRKRIMEEQKGSGPATT